MSPSVLLALAACVPAAPAADRGYWVCVSNERSGDVTVIDGADGKAVATVPVGKRPRGLHPSPDGRTLYVAVSGSPITGPPKLDPKGKPIFEEPRGDADPAADGVAVVDLRTRKFVKRLPAGADPEEFAVSADGRRLYIANEDVGTLSVANVADGKVERIVRVMKEPEGVRLTPDGRHVYVTCETGGEGEEQGDEKAGHARLLIGLPPCGRAACTTTEDSFPDDERLLDRHARRVVRPEGPGPDRGRRFQLQGAGKHG